MENQNPPTTPAPETPVVQDLPVSNSEKPKPKLPLAAIIGIIIFLFLAGGAAASFTVFKPQIMSIISKPSPTLAPSPTEAPAKAGDPTANWKAYTNSKYQFSLKYPSGIDFSADELSGSFFQIEMFSGKLDFNRNYLVAKKPYQKAADNEHFFSLEISDKSNADAFPSCSTYNQKKIITINMHRGVYSETSTIQGGGPGYSKFICIENGQYKYQFLTQYSANSPQGSKQAVIQLFNQVLSTFKFTDNSSTSNDIPKEIGDFPIYPGANFVQTKAKSDCGENQAPPDSNCYNIQYIFSTNDAFQKVYAFDINKTDTGWICSGGAGEIDAPTPTTGSTTTSCKKGDKNYFYTRSGNTQGSQIIIGIPAN